MALRYLGVVAPGLAPSAIALAIAVVLDLAIGDPVYPLHPVRLIGATLTWIERALRAVGLDGYAGGIVLFLLLGGGWIAGLSALVVVATRANVWGGAALSVFLIYSFLALGDLLVHVRRIDSSVAAGDLARARAAVGAIVGRDTDRMDGAACRRAAVESLGESLVDGYTSAVFWYLVVGLPGLVLFKVVSTMDSMVGYKTERYLRFGWCGARTDDVMNYVPARVTWALLGLVAFVVPGCSALKAWRVGLAQHGVVPGPNSGWSEAATAGGIQRRLVGPIWNKGRLVTEIWVGDPSDPPLQAAGDVRRAVWLVTLTGIVAVGLIASVILAAAGRG